MESIAFYIHEFHVKYVKHSEPLDFLMECIEEWILPGVFPQQQTCQLSSLTGLDVNSKALTVIPHSAKW